MTDLHFAGITESAKSQHVRARSRENLRQYIEVVHHTGEEVNYDRDAMLDRFQSYAGETRESAKETNAFIKKLGFLDRKNKPTTAGKFAGEVAAQSRIDLLRDIFIQHFRAMPTIAYTLDIMLDFGGVLTSEEIHSEMVKIATTDSSSQSNSVRNALNLLEEFTAVKKVDNGYEYIQRTQPTLEAVPYGIFLLGMDKTTIDAPVLRERLPRLVHCEAESCERLMKKAQKRYNLFTYRTTGDTSRTTPFGGVFEVQVGDGLFNSLRDNLL
ncbi:hypothetical protein [Halovenus halobia]|uniref:hypothetical protein n=1 Tax=Halovenus halobia TaxID=3396622 RepID=UPI003F550451